MASEKRIFTWLGAFIALSPAFIACGSSVPARPAALDPSNPDGPESPRMMSSGTEPSAPMAMDMDMDANAEMASPDAGATPMHHDHQPQHPGGTGTPPMDMTDAGAPSAAASSDTATVYTCTMHPEVTSNKPGRCPKCGMKLVPKAKAVAPNPPAGAHGATGGIAPSSGGGSK